MPVGNELLGEGLTLSAFLVFLMQYVEISPCFQACYHMRCDLKMCTFARVLFFQRKHISRWLGRLWRNWTGAWTSWRPFRPIAPSVRWPRTRCAPMHSHTHTHLSCCCPVCFPEVKNPAFQLKTVEHSCLCSPASCHSDCSTCVTAGSPARDAVRDGVHACVRAHGRACECV